MSLIVPGCLWNTFFQGDFVMLPSPNTLALRLRSRLVFGVCVCLCVRPGWNLAQHTGYPDKIFHGFRQSFHWCAGIIRLGYDQFLLNPFQFTIHYHSSLYSLRYWQCVVSSTRIKRWRPHLTPSIYQVGLRYVNAVHSCCCTIQNLSTVAGHQHQLHI
jgi:hypothetical protein